MRFYLKIFQPFTNVKTILSPWATLKQVAGHYLPTPEVYNEMAY